MNGVTALALFCEDIRREGGARDTLIGVKADTTRVPNFPGRFKNISAYFRVRFEIGKQYPDPVGIEVEAEGMKIEQDSPTGPIPPELIESAIKNATAVGSPYATIIGRIEFEGLVIPQPVTLKAMLRVGSQTELCGILNIVAETKSASTAS